MQFTTQQSKLIKTLSNLVRNTDSKNPLFANIEIKCIENTLELSASNGKVTIYENLEADIQDPTPIAVPAQKFYEIVSKLDGLISFDNGLIKCGKHKLTMNVLSTLQLPSMDFDCEMTQIYTQELKQALKGRLFACAKLESQIISGVCLNGDEIVSTDGNVMSLCKLNNALPFDIRVLDNKLAEEIIKTFEDEKVEIGFGKNKVMIKSDNIKMIGMLLYGIYPKYQQLIPQPRYNVKLVKNEVLKTLDIIKLTTDIKNICYFNFDDDKLIIGTKDGSSEIDIKYNDEPMKIWFNINYMSDCLKNISGDIVNFGFIAPLNACIIEAGNEKTLIMPVKNS